MTMKMTKLRIAVAIVGSSIWLLLLLQRNEALCPRNHKLSTQRQQRQNAFNIGSVFVREQKKFTLFSSTSSNNDDGQRTTTTAADSSSSSATTAAAISAATQQQSVLNGKRVVPYKIMMGGLKGMSDENIPTVYAVLNSSYQRGTDGWNTVSYVGVTQDLQSTLQSLQEQDVTELKVAHVRALSFTIPQPNAMQEVASQWRNQALDAGATLEEQWANDVLDYLFEKDDDDNEDDDDEDDMEMMADAMAAQQQNEIISPFATTSDETTTEETIMSGNDDNEILEFTASNVDKVLDEVRPYLIADGGNVSVERVDEINKNVYLKLEGACGSCASSTVTMQMGIERVLKENFPDINGVLQIEDDEESKPKELTIEAVQDEVNRLRSAVIAMGGVVELLGINSETGVVDIKFIGANKVQQGLELALLDIPFVNKINFVTDDIDDDN